MGTSGGQRWVRRTGGTREAGGKEVPVSTGIGIGIR